MAPLQHNFLKMKCLAFVQKIQNELKATPKTELNKCVPDFERTLPNIITDKPINTFFINIMM